jgi:hypothetical protein
MPDAVAGGSAEAAERVQSLADATPGVDLRGPMGPPHEAGSMLILQPGVVLSTLSFATAHDALPG